MRRKQNILGAKYGNQKNITKSQMDIQHEKELEKLEEDPKVKIHIDSRRTTLKNTKLEDARTW